MDTKQISDKIKSFFSQENLEKVFSKQGVEAFFGPIIRFITTHKVVSSIAAVVILLVMSVVLVGNHYLNKINYDDGSDPSLIYTQVAVVTLGTGETIDLEQAELRNDGTYKLADGRIYKPDGSVTNPDGSIIFADGSYITAAGIAVLSDGTTIYQDGLIVFQDGSYISGSGIVISKDGVATFSNGSMAHISTFTIEKSGRINLKPGTVVQGTPNGTTDGTIGTTIGGVYTTTTVVTDGVAQVVLPSAVGTTANNTTTTDKYESVFGTTTTKPSSDNKVTTPSTTNIVDLEDSDQVISSVKQENEEIKEKLEENDELIQQNLNDSEIWYHDDIKNILLMGIDGGSKSFPYGRSDAMIIVSINKRTKKVKLISLSRAAYVAISGYENTRLNHAHGYGGPRLAIKTIEDNYKIRIDNYVSTTFSAFQALIDAIGGVDIAFSSAEASALKGPIKAAGLTYAGAGTYKLNGKLALEYVRLRKIDTDRQRTARQRKILTAIANRAKNMSVFELNDMLNKVLPYITTDLSKSDIVGQLVNVPSYLSNSFEQHVLPHKSSALTLIGNFEVITVDWKDEVAYTHKLIYSGVTPSYYKR